MRSDVLLLTLLTVFSAGTVPEHEIEETAEETEEGQA
jgi:hypothetical protein